MSATLTLLFALCAAAEPASGLEVEPAESPSAPAEAALAPRLALPPPKELDARFSQLAARRRVPAKKLAAVTRSLVEVRVARATELEAQARWAEAVEELQAATRRIARARTLGASAGLPTLDGQVLALRAAGAADHRERAREAFDAGSLAEALARLDAASALDGTAPAGALRAQVHIAWADRSAERGDPYATSDHLVLAVEADPLPETLSRANTLNVALGRRLLELGACRAAYVRLRAVTTADAKTDRSKARACATTGVRLQVTSELAGAHKTLAGDVNSVAIDYLLGHGSEFIEVDGDTTRLVPTDDGTVTRGPLAVDVVLRSVVVQVESPSREVMTTYVGAVWSADGGSVPVRASWEELREPVVARVTAVGDWRDGPDATGASFRLVGVGTDEARWTGRVVGYAYDGGYRQQVASVTWGSAGDPRTRNDPVKARASARRSAVDGAARALGESVGRQILRTVDYEPFVRPESLALPAPW